jgi:hypothetical protein
MLEETGHALKTAALGVSGLHGMSPRSYRALFL